MTDEHAPTNAWEFGKRPGVVVGLLGAHGGYVLTDVLRADQDDANPVDRAMIAALLRLAADSWGDE